MKPHLKPKDEHYKRNKTEKPSSSLIIAESLQFYIITQHVSAPDSCFVHKFMSVETGPATNEPSPFNLPASSSLFAPLLLSQVVP